MSETDKDKNVLANQDAHPIKLAASCTSSALEITSWLNNTRQRRKLLYNSGFFRAFLTFNKRYEILPQRFLSMSSKQNFKTSLIIHKEKKKKIVFNECLYII